MTPKQKAEALHALKKAEEQVQSLAWALQNNDQEHAGRALTAFLAWMLSLRKMLEVAA